MSSRLKTKLFEANTSLALYNQKIDLITSYVMLVKISQLWKSVDVKLHPFKKKNIKSFCMHIKHNSFLTIFFLYLTILVDTIGIKPALGDHESNFKMVGAISCKP